MTKHHIRFITKKNVVFNLPKKIKAFLYPSETTNILKSKSKELIYLFSHTQN